jgi:hypothetical protein
VSAIASKLVRDEDLRRGGAHRISTELSAGMTTISSPPRSLDQPLERTRPQQAFRRDVSVFNVREEFRLDPCGLRLTDGFREFRLRTDDSIELFANLARHRARPTGPHLAHVS